MNINKIDFYNLCLDESPNLYSEVFNLDKDEFNKWIRGSLKEIITLSSYEEVVPDAIVLNEITKLGYEHIYYQCHYSAKATVFLLICNFYLISKTYS